MLTALFEGTVQTVISLTSSLGYFGIFVLMTIESTFIPFPAELILIPAGALVAQGDVSALLVLIAAIAGSVAGALINYVISWHLGRRVVNRLIHKYGKIFLLNEESLLKTEKYFDKHGDVTTFVGRLVPGVRSFVSIPAGFGRMNVLKFSVYTGLGAGIWCAMLIYLGYLFGNNFDLVRENLDIISLAALMIALWVLLGYLVIRLKRSN